MQLTFPSTLTPASPRSRLALLPWLASLLIVLLVSTALRAETYNLPGTNITLTYSISGNPATATITDCNDDATGALVIPDTLGGAPVTSIGFEAFSYCTSLTSVTIPNSVTSIGYYAFANCTSLTSVTIPNSVTYIGHSAFNSCTSLTSVTIPNSVTSIGDYAFYVCTNLTSVTIPNNVTSIGYVAFYSCTSLTAFIVDPSNSAYSSLGGVLFNKAKTVLIQYPSAKKGSSFTIPNSVTSIDYFAFSYCTSLTSVTIPNSVTSIRSRAFDDCTSLTAIIVNPANSDYSSLDGVLFNKAQSELIQYPIAKTEATYTIPNHVTSIGNSAFSSCTSLTSVTIPNSITNIGDGAFYGCTSLTSVTIPNSVTSIGVAAFSGCSSLTSVTIPNSVIYIGDGAFSYCTSLTSVTFTGNAPASFGYSVFNHVASGFTIYYPPWASGFSTPTWKGYPAQPTLFYADTTYAVGGGWKWNGLGYFYDGFYPFLWLPQQQKWLYLVGSDEDSFYFFDFTRGYWGWTARSYYPLGVMLDGPQNGVWVEL